MKIADFYVRGLCILVKSLKIASSPGHLFNACSFKNACTMGLQAHQARQRDKIEPTASIAVYTATSI